MNFLKSLNLYDVSLMAGIIAVTVIYSIITHDVDALAMVSAICGVINVVLCAKGSIYNYAFGLVYCATYAFIAFQARTYGLAVEYAAYFVPMQIVGWVNWKRNLRREDASLVKARRMNTEQALLTVAVTLAAIIAGWAALQLFDGDMQLLDAAITILNIVAMVLMVKAFTIQWALWTLADVLLLLLWILKAAGGEAHSGVMVIMWSFYTINSIGGWLQWKRSEKASE